MTELRRRQEREDTKLARQLRATLFLSLFLHGVGAGGVKADQLKREVRARLNTSHLTELVDSIHLTTERGEKIPQPDQFLTSADALKNGFSEEMVETANRTIKTEVTEALALVRTGANEQQVMDFLLSTQGAHAKGQNSMVMMMSLPPDQRRGNCNARFQRLAAEVPQIYPEYYQDGRLAGQLFQGADTNGDGVLDTPPHIRFVMDLQNGTHLIVEGTTSFVEADIADPAKRPTTVELSKLLTESFLANQGLYTHPQGVDTVSKSSEPKFKSFLDYPASPVSYGPNPNPDSYTEPVPSTGWSGYPTEGVPVTLLDEQPAEPTEELYLFPVIDSPAAARALPKDERTHIETITSVEAAQALDDVFDGELIIERIPSVEIAKVLAGSSYDALTIGHLDSVAVAETIITQARLPLNIDRVFSPEIAKIIARDTYHRIVVGEITPETAYILSHGERDHIAAGFFLTPELARQLASGRLRSLETTVIDSPELAQALKSGSIKRIQLGIDKTYGSPYAALDSPTLNILIAQALVGGSIEELIDRYDGSEGSAKPEAMTILEQGSIEVIFYPLTRPE